MRHRQGALYGQYRIHSENFLKVCIKIPSLQEQEKIAEFLSKQDELIEKEEEEKLSLLKEQKKGFLQQMFV